MILSLSAILLSISGSELPTLIVCQQSVNWTEEFGVGLLIAWGGISSHISNHILRMQDFYFIPTGTIGLWGVALSDLQAAILVILEPIERPRPNWKIKTHAYYVGS